MRRIEPIDVATAEKLVNFRGRGGSAFSFARQQLEGAVALHNLLAAERFAYIADEVGMGKTYVALGTIGLLRHFNPGFRVLYVVPKENLQRKWQKEARNFAAKNWLQVDHRVKTFQDTPARELFSCGNLLEFIRETALNSNRDFLLRMSSFSLPLAGQTAKWVELRDKVLAELPWISPNLFDLRNKAAFKDAFARAVNSVMPEFDLLVVDEAHNLKHGFGANVSSRNRLLALALGHPDADAPIVNGCTVKADRVLALSATPIETTFRELWNQMDVLCLGDLAPALAEEDRDDSEKKNIASRYLVRRVADLKINGLAHTKNMYRREWRGGGVSVFDSPMEVADTAQRLIVALIQKKVSEVFQKTGRKVDGHFSRSFQIGMLSSFESFLQTAKVRTESDQEATFDQDEQASTSVEKDGIDTPSIAKISRAYEQRFGEPMPHPKMDMVGRQLWAWVLRGEKSLVFVRRIASVKELRDKIAHEYDRWLFDYIRSRLDANPGVLMDFERAVAEYGDAHVRRVTGPLPAVSSESSEAEARLDENTPADDDTGGLDNFFAWFFRGEGPAGLISGASFRKIRLGSEGAALATFFEENYVALVLGEAADSGAVLSRWEAECTNCSRTELRSLAYQIFRRSKQKKFPRRRVYFAYQEAALRLLMACDGEIGARAGVVVEERFNEPFPNVVPATPESFPEPNDSLDSRTFFTELALRPELHAPLFPDEGGADYRSWFRSREQRRELLTSAITLGHPMIDLWLLAVRRLPSIRRGAGERGEETPEAMANAFLDLLASQRDQPGLNSWRELEEIGRHFELILNVNFPELQTRPIQELPGYYRAAMQRQTPVGGMWGSFNQQMVSQFRMPGYPYVLITTDVVQEGEDLHTFCSRVVHYGITWTPSAMEQRTGRVDRIGSKAHRRLDGASGITEDDYLQVLFPFLPDTVEVVQVQEVFRRMNRFLDLMHEAIQKGDLGASSIDITQRIVASTRVIPPNRQPLRSSFAIDPKLLQGASGSGAIADTPNVSDTIQLFNRILDEFSTRWQIEWTGKRNDLTRSGVARLANRSVLRRDALPTFSRRQPFTASLRTSVTGGHVLLRCASPVGKVSNDDDETICELLSTHQKLGRTKLCSVLDENDDTLSLAAETHVVFDPRTTDLLEAENALLSVLMCADELEDRVFGSDEISEGWLAEEAGA
ncbi:MAG: DEAD/DEAH box helicase family protein [Acidobacteria bacterium]|nr:DEAD/DEAH box helicase family protein [Acidobacteriota bacterium]